MRHLLASSMMLASLAVLLRLCMMALMEMKHSVTSWRLEAALGPKLVSMSVWHSHSFLDSKKPSDLGSA